MIAKIDKLTDNGLKQVELVMQTSLQLLPLIMNNIPQAVFWKDHDLVYLGCNQAFADDAGFSSPKEIVGKTDFDMPWTDQAELYRADDRQVMENGEPKLNYEEPQTTPSGSTIWLSTSKIPVHENGQVVAILGMYEDITARKQAENALRAREEQFRSIYDNATIGLYRTTPDGRILMINPTGLRLLGFDSFEDISRRNLEEAGFEEEDARKKFREKLEQDGVIDQESVWTKKDGSSIFVRESSTVSRDENGNVLYYDGSFEDITDRKMAAEAVRESEERFRRFSEATLEGLVFHEQGKIMDVNPAAVSLFGLSNTSDLIGRNLLEFIVPEYHQLVIKKMQLESVTPYEVRGIRQDGTSLPIETSTRAYKFGDRVMRASSIRDITERKAAEQALQENQRLLQVVMDNIPQAVFWKDRKSTFMGSNQAFAKDGGLNSPQDLIGKTDYDMPWKEQAELYIADDQRVMETGETKINYEEPHTGEAGVTTWVRTSKIPMRNDDGKIFAVLGMYEDITEWKNMQQRVQELFERRGYQVQISTEISQEIAAASEIDDLFGRVVTLTKERLGYYHTQLLRYDATQDAVVLINGYGETGQKMLASGHKLPMGNGLIGTAAASGQTILRPTLTEDPDWQPNPLLPDTKGEIAVPIKLGKQILGVLDVQSNRAGALTEDDRLLLEGLCGQIAVAIEQTRLREEMVERFEEVNRLNRAMSREGWQTYRETATVPTGFMFDQGGLKSVKDTGLAEELFANFPLTVPGGETIGSLAIVDDPQHPLSPEDEVFLQQVSDQVALALESARLLEQTQLALYEFKESQELTRNVIDSTDDWIFVKDRSHRYQLVNQGYANALHIAVEEFIGKNDLELGFPEELVKGNPEKGIRGFWTDDQQVLDSGMVQHYPDDPASIDGKIRIFDTIKIPLKDANNNVWGVLAFSRDLTERKQAEGLIAQRATQLEAVATVSTTASTVLDPDKLLQAVVDLTKERFNLYHTHIFLADDLWNTLLLAAGAGEVGRQMVDAGHAIEMDAEKSLVARALRERSSIIVNDVQSEAGFLPNPMLPETRSEMAVPMIVGDKVIGVFDVQSDTVGHFTDADANIYTTLASQVAVALQNARLYVEQAATVTQLRELDRLKSSFLANMSHELRTPLNSILGFADVMLEELDGPLTENMQNDLGLIYKNGQHLLHLINDVLDMAKIESGKMNLNIEKFNLQEIIEEVTSITSPLASEKNLALFIEPDSDHEVEINADKIRLRQVMINLINNSIKFTEKGKIAIHVTREETNVLISVKDTGIGIPVDHLESVFQEFTQVDTTTTRKVGGTGLGLPISRRLIEMHSGRLWVESTGVEGEGSTFYVFLPIEAKVNEAQPKVK